MMSDERRFKMFLTASAFVWLAIIVLIIVL